MKKWLVWRSCQHGKATYTTVVRAKELLEYATVPRYDQRTGKGYQRYPNEARVEAAAKYLENGGDFPNSVYINSRKTLKFTPLEDAGILGVDIGWAYIPDDAVLYIVDGQHRLFAIERAASRTSEFENYEMPVVLTNISDEVDEMNNFIDIQDNAKAIATDLAIDLRYKRARAIGDIRELMREGRLKEARNIKMKVILNRLNEDKDSFWYGKLKIVSPTPEQKKEDPGIVSNTSMSNSLKKFISSMDGEGNPSVLADRILNYWRAIANVCSEARDDPEKYPYLYNTTGVYIVNMLLPDVMVKASGDYSVAKFEKIVLATGMTSMLWIKDGMLKGIGGIGGFSKVANNLRVGLAFL